jgi:hypothetical protein
MAFWIRYQRWCLAGPNDVPKDGLIVQTEIPTCYGGVMWGKFFQTNTKIRLKASAQRKYNEAAAAIMSVRQGFYKNVVIPLWLG